MGWSRLPPELLATLFGELAEIQDLRAVAGVCAAWRLVACDHVWQGRVKALARRDFSVFERGRVLAEAGDPHPWRRTFLEVWATHGRLWSRSGRSKVRQARVATLDPADHLPRRTTRLYTYADLLVLVHHNGLIELWRHVAMERIAAIVPASSGLEITFGCHVLTAIYQHLLVVYHRDQELVQVYDLQGQAFVWSQTLGDMPAGPNQSWARAHVCVGINERCLVLHQPLRFTLVLEHGLIRPVVAPNGIWRSEIRPNPPSVEIMENILEMNNRFLLAECTLVRLHDVVLSVREFAAQPDGTYGLTPKNSWESQAIPGLTDRRHLSVCLSASHLVGVLSCLKKQESDEIPMYTQARIFCLNTRQYIHDIGHPGHRLGPMRLPFQWLMNDQQLALVLNPGVDDESALPGLAIYDLPSKTLHSTKDVKFRRPNGLVSVHTHLVTFVNLSFNPGRAEDEGVLFEEAIESKSFWPNIE